MSTTRDMTYAALCWLKYEKNCDFVVTELGERYIKDVYGLWIGNDGSPTKGIEIEVKTSISDLKRDFSAKKTKHRWYTEGKNTPNYLYYLVPKSLEAQSVDIITEQNKSYGVLGFDAEVYLEMIQYRFSAGKSIYSASKVKKLTDKPPHPAVLRQMARRIQNEYFFQKAFIQEQIKGIEMFCHSFGKMKE